MGQGGLALDLVLWLPMCLFQIAFFGMNASLKWMTWQSKLKSGAYITKKKKPTVRLKLHTIVCLTFSVPHVFVSVLCRQIFLCVCVLLLYKAIFFEVWEKPNSNILYCSYNNN